jgi:hypothetical protein
LKRYLHELEIVIVWQLHGVRMARGQ